MDANFSDYLQGLYRERVDAHERCSGTSTRLADHYVQELFTHGYVTIRDHWDSKPTHLALFERVVRRLVVEHSHEKFTVDRSRCDIYLEKHHNEYIKKRRKWSERLK